MIESSPASFHSKELLVTADSDKAETETEVPAAKILTRCGSNVADPFQVELIEAHVAYNPYLLNAGQKRARVFTTVIRSFSCDT